MHSTNIPLRRTEDIVVQKSGDELLVYDLSENKAACLNKTSALVLDLCDGTRTVSEIRKSLGKTLKSPVNEDLVILALDQLNKNNLLENGDSLKVNFEDVSRRSIIQKIALSSVIALPIISSIIAPRSAHAQSCIGTGGTSSITNGIFSGSIPSDECFNALIAACCTGTISSGGCSCSVTTCTGSVTCT